MEIKMKKTNVELIEGILRYHGYYKISQEAIANELRETISRCSDLTQFWDKDAVDKTILLRTLGRLMIINIKRPLCKHINEIKGQLQRLDDSIWLMSSAIEGEE